MSFTDLRLIEPIVRAVAKEGYTTPTPIQHQAIPHALAGRDVLGCAQTGTGKTAAFAMPVLQHLANGLSGKQKLARGRRPRAIVLCPTRELASQIHDSFNTYGRQLPLRHGVIFGGVSQFQQVRNIRDGVDVLIATPGRLLDLMQQGHIDLSAIEILVLDEADRMLDMGFITDIRKVVQQLPERRQTLFFSATMPKEIKHLADSLLTDPVMIQSAAVASTADAINQSVYMVSQPNKPVLLERLLIKQGGQRTLIFTRTKRGADRLVKRLHAAKLPCAAIHSDKSQSARTFALRDFKNGKNNILIATDIASRGIDVDNISLVVNYDLPDSPESYVHRIGRTARGGASGNAVSFCDETQSHDLRCIERVIKQEIMINTDEADLCFTPGSSGTPGSPGSAANSGRGRGNSRGFSAGNRGVSGGNNARGSGHKVKASHVRGKRFSKDSAESAAGHQGKKKPVRRTFNAKTITATPGTTRPAGNAAHTGRSANAANPGNTVNTDKQTKPAHAAKPAHKANPSANNAHTSSSRPTNTKPKRQRPGKAQRNQKRAMAIAQA